MAKNSVEKPKKMSRKLLALRIVGGAAVVTIAVSVGAWAFIAANQTHEAQKSSELTLREAVTLDSAESQTATVNSKLGFSVPFNKQMIDADGKVIKSATQADVYTDDDVLTARSYAVADFVVKRSVSNSSGIGKSFPPSLAVLTNANRDFFERERQKSPNLSETDLVVTHYAPQPGTDSVATLKSRVAEQVGAVTYQKLTYTIIPNDFPSNIKTEVQYITVQYGRPYALVIDYFSGTQQSDVALLVQIIAAIQYQTPAADAEFISARDGTTRSVASRSFVLADETVKTPSTLASGTDISIVAKNQLAVVRVGSINCYTLTLTLPNGATALQAENACTAAAGSGSIVTKDGYVVTNGHVTEGEPTDALLLYLELAAQDGNTDPLKQYLAYLKASHIVTPAESAALETALQHGDDNAEEALTASIDNIPAANLKASVPTRSYAIQLSNEPIKITFDGTKIVFKNLSGTVAPAMFVDKNYSGGKDAITAASSDVALLKITKNATYPTVELGSTGNIRASSQITVVGFPGFVDGGLQSTQAHTIPTATQGKVVDSQKVGVYNLIETSVPLAQGNSGGPAFDGDGRQIGIATYVKLSSADPELGVSKFGKYSYLRDIADAKALASKNKVTPASSPVSDNWHAGIDAFAHGNYADAAARFTQTKQSYGDNYLVADLAARAQAKADESFRALIIPGVAIIVSIVVLGVVVVMIVRHKRQQSIISRDFTPLSAL